MQHRPFTNTPQALLPDTTLQATWRACESLVSTGATARLGVAHFSLAQVEEVLSWATVRPAVCVLELHPLLAQRKMVGVCLRKVWERVCVDGFVC